MTFPKHVWWPLLPNFPIVCRTDPRPDFPALATGLPESGPWSIQPCISTIDTHSARPNFIPPSLSPFAYSMYTSVLNGSLTMFLSPTGQFSLPLPHQTKFYLFFKTPLDITFLALPWPPLPNWSSLLSFTLDVSVILLNHLLCACPACNSLCPTGGPAPSPATAPGKHAGVLSGHRTGVSKVCWRNNNTTWLTGICSASR
jgi:hypothetical protein